MLPVFLLPTCTRTARLRAICGSMTIENPCTDTRGDAPAFTSVLVFILFSFLCVSFLCESMRSEVAIADTQELACRFEYLPYFRAGTVAEVRQLGQPKSSARA